MAVLRAALVLATVSYVLAADKLSGLGSTGLYWDCCKPSCSWNEKANWLTHPVNSCTKNDSLLPDFTAGSACGQGGTAYVCNNQQPWAVNDTFSYGFISAYIVGASETDWCCSCYELNFTNGDVQGKRMIVQASNTGYDDPKRNIFGVGAPGDTDYADACLNRYDGAGSGFLGKNGKLLRTRDECGDLPTPLQPGCYWRFDWWEDAYKPNMTFQRVKCPKALTDITGCIRKDEETFTSTGGRVLPMRTQSSSLFTISLMMTFAFIVGF
ncbi:Endoglucanase-5 [Orbilia brochopaga]|nr:Endoglucanase-5 [Drechslerella brochopaga]